MESPSPDLDAFEELTARRRSSLVCDRDREVPGPLLERVCSLVFAAPNHKKTTPWQVAVFTGAARATLGELLAADLVAEAPDIAPEKVDKTRVKYGRAPAIVVAGCRPDPDDPLRHREDLFAVAAGVENLLLGVASAGLTALWSSPPVVVPSALQRPRRIRARHRAGGVGLRRLAAVAARAVATRRPRHPLVRRPAHLTTVTPPARRPKISTSIFERFCTISRPRIASTALAEDSGARNCASTHDFACGNLQVVGVAVAKVSSRRSTSSWSWIALEPVAGLPDSTRATWRRS